jgi:hypothetical protein
MSAEQQQWYPSKVDWWLVPILCMPPVAAVAACVASALEGSMPGLLVGAAMAVFVAGLYFGVVFPMRYGLDDTLLIVRSGAWRRRIPLAEISEVSPTRSPLSSPALSLDRLRVQFGQGFFNAVMISPADRDRFLNDLADKAGLRREGERLYRS